MSQIASRDNPRVRRWRALVRDARMRRKEGRAVIEGEHLIAACLDSGNRIESLLISRSAEEKFKALASRTGASIVLPDAIFRAIADTEAPSGVAAEIVLPPVTSDLKRAHACVFLESIQDAGNVGTILRSAAAFGVGHAVLGPGCADAWSPKVLRAGMGAHFAISLSEGDLQAAIERFDGRLCCTVARGGIPLAQADLAGRIGWLFGSEGQGVSPALAGLAALKVTIPMPGGAESLNVAAAAAICFYEGARKGERRSTP